MAFSQPIYQIRGTALKPYYSKGYSETATDLHGSAAAAIVPTALGTSGVFGSSVLDYSTTGSTDARSLVMNLGGGNVPTTAISLLFRIVPLWTGNPSTAQPLIYIGDGINLGENAIVVKITTLGKIDFEVYTPRGTNAAVVTTATSFSFSNGVPTDIMVTWDGTTAANAVKFYQDGTLIESATATAAMTGFNNKMGGLARSGLDYVTNDRGTKYYLNELCIFDSVQPAYAPRSGFVTSSNLNGDTIPAAADVRSGTITGLNTGSLAVPARADVRSGVAVDASTGTCAVPAAADVRRGTAVDAGTGSAYIPARTDVRSGTNVDATTGTLAVPAASQVLSGVSVDAGVGTYVTVLTTNVRSGITFGAGGGLTGSAVIPARADVRLGTAVDSSTGTLDLPDPSNVSAGVVYDNGTKTGTRQVVTNLLAESVLIGPNTIATLEAE